MVGHGRRDQVIAAALAALAGYVDAIGFIASGGLFLSFMTGNSTRLGVGLSQHGPVAALAAGLLGAFVAGVTLATLVGGRLGRRRQRAQLLLVAGLLGLAALAAAAGQTVPALLLAATAMGAENCVFEAGGDVKISLTFMTGNLVKVGQRLARALDGGNRWDWLPYLALWLAMLGGAAMGALAWTWIGLGNLGIAAGIAAALAFALREDE